ncbi:kinase-like domain-containing protein, partial [Piptocephalis cylindrospora]
IGNYMLGETLGDGTYGKVKVAYHRLIGARVAMKMVDKSHAVNLVREVEHWRRLNHPRIARLHELIVTESKIYLAMELASRGELLDWLTREGRAPEALARHWFRQTLSAVSYLHHRNLVHRDLKLENILLDDQLNVKLVDFGFAREWDSLRMLHTYCGSVAYAAPEMIAGKSYKGPEVDVWSMGVILYTLLCGSLPFDDDEAVELQSLILRGKYEVPEDLGDVVTGLIDRCLRVKPKERLDVDGIDAHAWLASTER